MIVAVAAGCGDIGKPGYCGDLANLQASVKGLVGAASEGGVSGLKSQVAKIESSATATVSAAKEDFPTETSAITSSIDKVKSEVEALPSNPSFTQLAMVVTDAAAVVKSVQTFADATSDKCD
jgi:hypothetical protein